MKGLVVMEMVVMEEVVIMEMMEVLRWGLW